MIAAWTIRRIRRPGRERLHVGLSARTTGESWGDAEPDRAPRVGEQHGQLDRRAEDANRAGPQISADDQDVDLRERGVGTVDDQQDPRIPGDAPGIVAERGPGRKNPWSQRPHEQHDGGRAAGQVSDRAAERGAGGACTGEHQRDARDQLDRALGECDAELEVDPADRGEHHRHQVHAVAEQGQRHRPGSARRPPGSRTPRRSDQPARPGARRRSARSRT